MGVVYVYVCVWVRESEREGGRQRERKLEFYLAVSVPSQGGKNRIVSSILGIKAKPSVIVSTILTAVNRP